MSTLQVSMDFTVETALVWVYLHWRETNVENWKLAQLFTSTTHSRIRHSPKKIITTALSRNCKASLLRAYPNLMVAWDLGSRDDRKLFGSCIFQIVCIDISKQEEWFTRHCWHIKCTQNQLCVNNSFSQSVDWAMPARPRYDRLHSNMRTWQMSVVKQSLAN